MDDDVAVVLNHPLARFVTLDSLAAVAGVFHGSVYLFGKSVNLAAARAGGQDKEVVEWSDAPHVQDSDVSRLVIVGDASGKTGTFKGGCQLRGGATGQCGGAQWTSFAAGSTGRRSDQRRNALIRMIAVVVTSKRGFRFPCHRTRKMSPEMSRRSHPHWTRNAADISSMFMIR